MKAFARIIKHDNLLIEHWGLHLWKKVKVLPKRMKWRGIWVEAIEQKYYHKGQTCSIFLKPDEYEIIEIH